MCAEWERAQFEAYFMRIDGIPDVRNLSAYDFGTDVTRNQYYIKSFSKAWSELNTADVDIYHQLDCHYRLFNPLLIANQVNNTPSVIGPAEPPHTVPNPSKKDFIRQASGIEWSDSFLDRVLPVMDWFKETIYDEGREILFERTLKQADRIVVVNEETADLYAKFASRSKIETIPYGVVHDRFKKSTPGDSVDMLAMGSLYRRKGYDVLIEAWSQIAPEFQDSTLHILGDGPLREYLDRRIDELNINDSVIFHGFVDREKVIEMLSSVRAFVHPSRSEGFPHVRLEAMASACPVIATDIIGTAEMIRDGTDGLVVPTGEHEPLAAAMAELLDNPQRANTMGRNALQHSKEKFDWGKISKEFMEIYHELL
jgi:glycosyltransferase involved in cell wall biosynthesis